MSILVFISIILVILIIILASQLVFKSSNPYGNRLDGKVEISESNLNKFENKMLEESKVSKAEVYIKGKVINFIYKTEEKENFDLIIKNMDEVLDKLSKKEQEFYDVQIFIEGQSEKLPIIGYKSNTADSITWTNR